MISVDLIERLRLGALMLYPTDTIWGIGCDATNEEACQRIISLKQRSTQKSFIVLVDSILMLKQFIPRFHPSCYQLIASSCRPLTIVYPQARGLAPSVLASDGSVGVRITNNSLCVELIQKIGRPIVSTSANISQHSVATTFDEIPLSIKNGVDFIVGDPLQHRRPMIASRIVKIDLDGNQTVIRE